jgi:hypothetical protein
MPAIDLARLKIKTARLAEKFNDPGTFLRELGELLDSYTNHTARPAQVALRTSLPSYRTPKPVLRQITLELAPLAEKDPAEAFALANALWEAGYLETRLLAASLAGLIPPASAMSLFGRIPEWLGQTRDKEITQALLTEPFGRIRRENPQAMLILLEEWLRTISAGTQAWGLHALIPLLNEPGFENLPAAFKALRPAVEGAGPATQIDLSACLVTLGRISPTETIHFLREILSSQPRPMMVRTLRRMLPDLPLALQNGLRDILRNIDTRIPISR